MNNKFDQIEILLQHDNKHPAFLVLKSYAGLNKIWYRLMSLSNDKTINSKEEYEVAVEEESWGPEIYRIIGKPPFSEEFIGVNCIYFSFSMFILCEEIEVEVDNNHIFLQMASVFVRKKDADEYIQIGTTEDLYLTAKDVSITIEDDKLIGKLNELSSKIISYNQDGEVDFTDSFNSIKKKYSEDYSDIGRNYFGKNYDDLEGLIEMSPYWPFNNVFVL